MSQTAKLTPADGDVGDFFGKSVDMSGDQIVIGAYFDEFGGSAYLFEKPSPNWITMTHTAKLTPSDGTSGDLFGNTVSISSDNVVVGSYSDDDNGSGSGSAYVFSKSGPNWTTMTETAKLTASDGVSNDAFGISVGISGDKIISGASGGDLGGLNVGSVYLFTKPVSGWLTSTQTQKIIPPTYIACPGCNYGWSVAIDGDYAVVGSPQYQNNGAAFVLFYNGSTWLTQAELTASDGVANDNFGYSVSISGDNIAIGATGDDEKGSNSGSAYVFTKPVSGWADMTETAKLFATDGTSNDELGKSISISGDNIAVGAYNAGTFGNEPGAVYVYTKQGGSWISMNQTAKLTASDGSHDDFFGFSVGISGDNIIVGSYSDDDNGTSSGSAYLFTKTGANWADMTQTAKLKPSDGSNGDFFGYSVGISGDNVVVGAYNDDDNQFNSGSAYIFTKSISGWANMAETAKLNPSDGTASSFDFFGRSVSISGNKVAVGAYGDSDNFDERSSGSAYLFVEPSSGWNSSVQSTRIRTSEPKAVSDNFGWSIGISGSKMITGAYSTDFYGDLSGSAYLFKEGCNTSNSLSISACNSYTSPSGNYTWTTSNIYSDTIPNAQSCDSVITIDLTINQPVTGIDNRTECNSLLWIDGNTYTSNNNTATFNITNGAANGCDSLVTLNLTIINSTTGTDTRTECNPFTWIDGNSYTSNNNSATFNIVNGASNGCDSLVTLDLTIINPSTGTDTRTECSPFTWIDGNSYTSNNSSATFNILNGAANGCDSLVTLDLTILSPGSSIDTHTECNSYTWIDGITYTASNNTATFNYVNGSSNGCDSIVTLDLTILNLAMSTDTRTECDSFLWIDGNTYTSSNNTATFNYINGASNGCDSVVTLDLTIANTAMGTDTRTECNSYTWIDGNTYSSSNNSATFNIVGGAANGCDSLVTLDLTIINSTSGIDSRIECSPFTWIDGNVYTTDNNSATFNIINGASNGCDSLVTLDLTISPVDVSLVVIEPTITANASGASYQWLDCNAGYSTIPGATSQSFTAITNGSYAVEVTENNCVDTSICTSITVLGIEFEGQNEIIVYPNPTRNIVNIEFPIFSKEFKVEIFNVAGQLQSTFSLIGGKSEIDLSSFNNGMYYLKISNEDSIETFKVVKQ